MNIKSQENIKVSVIVTAYNRAETIKDCLGSIFSQSLSPIEVIIVDDGSTDGTDFLIRKIIQSHENVTYIQNSKNRGAGAAKNIGLNKAVGEYISFVDSDDRISENFLLELYKTAKKYNSDFVVSNLVLDSGSSVIFDNFFNEDVLKFPTGYLTRELINDSSLTINKFQLMLHWAKASACNKLIKRAHFEGLRFLEKGVADDLSVVIPIIEKSKKINFSINSYYYYKVTPASDSRVRTVDRKVLTLQVCCQTLQLLRTSEIKKIFLLTTLVRVFMDCLICEREAVGYITNDILFKLRSSLINIEDINFLLDVKKNEFYPYFERTHDILAASLLKLCLDLKFSELLIRFDNYYNDTYLN